MNKEGRSHESCPQYSVGSGESQPASPPPYSSRGRQDEPQARGVTQDTIDPQETIRRYIQRNALSPRR